MTHNVYGSLEASNSLYNQQFTHQLASTNLDQILAQEKQNDTNFLAISQENELNM